MTKRGNMSHRTFIGQSEWEIFRWPLLMAFANAIGLVTALIGDGWYDVISWVTLGSTLIIMMIAWRGWRAAPSRHSPRPRGS
jgi:hypothetical protein